MALDSEVEVGVYSSEPHCHLRLLAEQCSCCAILFYLNGIRFDIDR